MPDETSIETKLALAGIIDDAKAKGSKVAIYHVYEGSMVICIVGED